LSLFDADAITCRPSDLEGLLAGPGQVVRMGGTARVSVVVAEEWRARALLTEFAERGVTGSQVASADGRLGIRTSFSAVLAPIAARWLKGAVTLPPEGFALTGPMLRLWFIAGGRLAPRGLSLQLSPGNEAGWRPVRASLARLGLPAALLGVRAGGPAYRIMGRRRLARIAGLIGARPTEAPPEVWPTVSGDPGPAAETGVASPAVRQNAGV
jgi:hypothetical protein